MDPCHRLNPSNDFRPPNCAELVPQNASCLHIFLFARKLLLELLFKCVFVCVFVFNMQPTAKLLRSYEDRDMA